jgi:hypothetical protein
MKRQFQKLEEFVGIKKIVHNDLMGELNHCLSSLTAVSNWLEYLEELASTGQKAEHGQDWDIENVRVAKAELQRYLADINERIDRQQFREIYGYDESE